MEFIVLIVGGYFIYRYITKKNQQKQQLFQLMNQPSEKPVQPVSNPQQGQMVHDDGNCKGCGAMSLPNAEECEYCGLRILRPTPPRQPQPVMKEQQTHTQPSPTWQPSRKNSSSSCLKGCGCFVMIIIVITVAMRLFMFIFGQDLIWILENL